MVIVMFSGGMDSLCTLAMCTKRYKRVKALTIDYNQSNSIEVEISREICEDMGIEHEIMTIGDIYGYGIANTWGSGSNLAFRNGLFISLGATRLGKHQTLSLGIEYDSHMDLYDTHLRFLYSMEDTIRAGMGNNKIKIWTPAHNRMTSTDIVKAGYKILGDHIFDSYTCYNGGYYQCGECMVCRFRHNTITEAGLCDKTYYNKKPKKLSKHELKYVDA